MKLPKFILLISLWTGLLISVGCDRNLSKKNSGSPEKPKTKIITVLDTTYHAHNIRIYFDPDGWEWVQGAMAREKSTQGVPLIVDVNGCKSGFSTVTDYQNFHFRFHFQDSTGQPVTSQIIQVPGQNLYFVSLYWQLGRIGVLGFRIEEDCPVILGHCHPSENKDEHIIYGETGEWIFDSKNERLLAPWDRGIEMGNLVEVTWKNNCFQVENLEGGPEMELDLDYTPDYVESVIGYKINEE